MKRSLCWLAIPLSLTFLVPGPAAAEGDRLRVMAANISSGRFQSYPLPGPGARIFQALDPDVVLIQEWNVNATRNGPNGADDVDAWVEEVFGAEFHWFREPGGDSIPNGVISRWPIVESGEWRDSKVGNRDFAYARIDLPGETDLWAVSVHLLTRSQGVRDTEAGLLVEAILGHPVPEGDFLVIGGDFNTDRRTERALETLGAVVETFGPFPADGADPPDEDTNSRRKKPYDWVLADAQLAALEIPVELGGLVFADGLVFDSRIFTQEELGESFPPVLRGDSDAPQMQHMAVVRDFRLGEAQAEPPPPPVDLPPVPVLLAPRAMCEASAALLAPWDADLILVADNEVEEQLYAFEVEDGALRPKVVLAMPAGDRPRDIEALAQVGDSVLVVGSHSRGGPCEAKPKRRRLRFLGARTDGTLEARGVIDSGELWPQAMASQTACLGILFTDPSPALSQEVCEALRSAEADSTPDSCRTFNVEGAFGTEDQRVWLGLRAPLVDGRAVLLRLTQGLDELRFDRVVLLDLEGRGVRELSLAGPTVFGLAGPEIDAELPFALFSIPLADLEAANLASAELTPSILRRDLPTSSEGLALHGSHAYVTTDGQDHEDPTLCTQPSGQYRVEVER
ncbi:MAG: DUF3616 domain-containing protein [Acidobacteria bacterium]|nr:DUF3616 domain-containing protein [Acidobacteriota bacterium]